MQTPPGQLAKTLGLPGAIALALGISLGAGLLVLTGLTYRQSGSAAIYAWIINGLIIVPILAIMALLGARHPNAEGVAGIVRLAFGRPAGVAVQALLLGTLSLAMPGISIVGGSYFAFFVGGGKSVAILASAAILVLTGTLNFFGARLSGRLQQFLTFGLLTVVALVALSGLIFGDYSAGSGIAPISQWRDAVPALDVIFFAFAGWIVVASTVEDYKNPARDYPITVFVTFAIVLGLYLLIALATQLTLSRDDPALGTAPVAAILSAVVGTASGKVVALLGALIICANLNGATWAFSRLVMASARAGLLPNKLAHIHARSRVPGYAVLTTNTTALIVLGAYAAGLVSLETLLTMAGQNFFILYLLCIASFVRCTPAYWWRAAGVLLAIFYLFRAARYGLDLLYPLALLCGGTLVIHLRERHRPLAATAKPDEA